MLRSYLFVALSATFYGYITVGGRLLSLHGFSLFEISLFPLLIVASVLGISSPRRFGLIISAPFRKFFAFYGLIGAMLQITQYGGIVLGVPVAVVAMLLYTQPIWTMLMGRLWLKERITRSKLVALGLALAGVMVLLNPFTVAEAYPTVGILSALAGGIVLGGWVIWTKRSERAARLPPLTRVFGYSFFSVLWLMALFPPARRMLGAGEIFSLTPAHAWQSWPQLLSLAVFGYLVPYGLLFLGINQLEATIAGNLLMLEPVSAALLAVILFREPLTWNVLAGGVLILASNSVLIRAGATSRSSG